MRSFCLLFLLLLYLPPVSALEASVKIINLSTENKKIIDLQFDKKHLRAQKLHTEEWFHATKDSLQLPVDFSPEEVVKNAFFIFDSRECIGEIEFCCCSQEYYKKIHKVEIPSYITLGRCSLSLPKASDLFLSPWKTAVSEADKKSLFKEINTYKSDAHKVFSGRLTKKRLVESCTLITQFIWSLNPLVCASKIPKSWGVMDKINGLKQQQVGMLCAGFRDLFIEIATVLLPNMKIRKVDAYRWHYPKCKNIVVDSHALVEVYHEGAWQLFDPTFRLYFMTHSGKIIDAEKIRLLKNKDCLDKIAVTHISTSQPRVDFFDDPNYCLDADNPSYWNHFNWLNYQPVQ